jgi:plasmid stability protein
MTTLTIKLDDDLAHQLQVQSAEVGTTVEEYVREILRRAAASSSLRALVRQNEARLREAGYKSEEEVERAIRTGIEDVRRAR